MKTDKELLLELRPVDRTWSGDSYFFWSSTDDELSVWKDTFLKVIEDQLAKLLIQHPIIFDIYYQRRRSLEEAFKEAENQQYEPVLCNSTELEDSLNEWLERNNKPKYPGNRGVYLGSDNNLNSYKQVSERLKIAELKNKELEEQIKKLKRESA